MRWLIAGALAALLGCGGEAATAVTGNSSSFPGVTASLTLDLTRLANYANPTYPVHYDGAVRGQDNAPAGNVVSDAGATLGRVLFFDKQLSVNNTVNCASCHMQPSGFTDADVLSKGFNGVDRTAAHSMRLGNARFYAARSAFWDKRAPSLEAQATQPIQNPVEMGFDPAHGGLEALFIKMGGLAYYPELFRLVYGDATITEDRIQRALAQYVRSLVSVNSRWDAGYAQVFNPQTPDRGLGSDVPGLSVEENRGKNLFLLPPPQGGAGCAGCHVAPTFSLAANSLSNGLDAGETRIFKAPSLKNVAVTGPYMHDGRLATLEQVVEHYVSGVQNGPALDNRLRGPGGQPQRLALNATDKAALVAFLKTLTDTTLNGDVRFSDPFRR
jgi:cytochrome c peroxidase